MSFLKGLSKFNIAIASTLILPTLCACGNIKQTAAPDTEIEAAPLPQLCINELMPANKAYLPDENSSFPDWIELYNAGDEIIQLENFSISDSSSTWDLPQASLAAGEYFVFFCSKDATGFSLSSNGEKLALINSDNRIVDEVSYDKCGDDESYSRNPDGSFSLCRYPTPGFSNNDAGYELFQSTIKTPTLSINEVMCFDRSAPDENGNCYDWIELKNTGSEEIELSDYYISDSRKNLFAYRLPNKQLHPGELFVVYCSDKLDTGFSLSSGGESIYLSHSDGSICDYVSVRNVPVKGSFGRMDGENGFFYFSEFSPMQDNSDGKRMISAMPVSDNSGGVFEGAGSVSVELSAPGKIFYTLDGSMPNELSAEYSKSLRFSKTSVLRAVCIEDGKLPSASLDLSFIINEGHSLPVASLVVDPDDMTGRNGIYTNPTEDWERPASVSFYDGDDSFSIACGVKVHGATSRITQSKKSYKLNFRDAYGGELHYDLFQNGVEDFSSVILRAAQESSFSTHMRDILMHELAVQCEPTLSVQAYKYCILYINGEYWGIYAFREAHSAEHYARNNGYDISDVTMYQGSWDSNKYFEQLYKEAYQSDLRKNENYEAIASHLDLDALYAWIILQTWSANIDINPPNVRYYYTESDQTLHYALVDLDLGFFGIGDYDLVGASGYKFAVLVRLLMENQQFRDGLADKLDEYLHNQLSMENLHATADTLAEQLRPEIERDGEKWGYTLKEWESEIYQYIYHFSDAYPYGYDYTFAFSYKAPLKLSGVDFQARFGDLKR